MLRSRQRDTRWRATDSSLGESLQVINNNFVTEFLVGTLSGHHEDFPQCDGKRPYVTFGRVFSLLNGKASVKKRRPFFNKTVVSIYT